MRNGNGTNPLGYAALTEPVLGQDWLVSVDIATPGHLASIVSFGLGGPVSGPTLNGFLQGQLLVLGPLLPPDIAVGSHAISVPLDLALLGATLATQGSTFTPGLVRLNNAIDATFEILSMPIGPGKAESGNKMCAPLFWSLCTTLDQ